MAAVPPAQSDAQGEISSTPGRRTVMHGTIQTLRLEHGFGLLRVPEGVEVFFHHGALPSPDHRPPLAVGRVVGFEVEPSPP
jgi:hypothetical protein